MQRTFSLVASFHASSLFKLWVPVVVSKWNLCARGQNYRAADNAVRMSQRMVVEETLDAIVHVHKPTRIYILNHFGLLLGWLQFRFGQSIRVRHTWTHTHTYVYNKSDWRQPKAIQTSLFCLMVAEWLLPMLMYYNEQVSTPMEGQSERNLMRTEAAHIASRAGWLLRTWTCGQLTFTLNYSMAHGISRIMHEIRLNEALFSKWRQEMHYMSGRAGSRSFASIRRPNLCGDYDV